MSNALKLLGVAIGAALVACQSVPPAGVSLDDARRALGDASRRAVVVRAAPLELDAARQALERAEKASAGDADGAEARHLAYLATQHAAAAMHRGDEREAQERLQALSLELARLRHDAGSASASRSAHPADAAATHEGPHDEVATALPVAGDTAASAQAAPGIAQPASLEQALLPLLARQTPRGLVVNLPHTLFVPRSSELVAGADEYAGHVARALQQWPEQRVLVEAFTADVGDEASRLGLSQARAAAFARALERLGVAPTRFEARGLGAAYPVADNATRAGQLRNERLEVLFHSAAGAAPRR